MANFNVLFKNSGLPDAKVDGRLIIAKNNSGDSCSMYFETEVNGAVERFPITLTSTDNINVEITKLKTFLGTYFEGV